jgi:hypothetical protein
VEKDLMPSFRQVTEMVRRGAPFEIFLDRPVERELIRKVIDAARFAPTPRTPRAPGSLPSTMGRRFGG